MKCPICGKQTLPGAKLCGPCRSALKRARDDSVWEMPGHPGGAPQASAAAPARWVLGAGRLPGWRGIALGALAMALSVGAGVLIARSGEAAKAANDRAAPVPASASVQSPVQAPAPMTTKAAAEVPAPVEAPPREEVTQPPRHEPPKAARPARPVPEPPAPPPAPAAEPVPVVEPPRPAPVPPRDLPPPIDPWQRMSDALDRCAAEDLFGRIRCEYRVRTSFCEGHWGEVPQCPGATVNDHGQ